MFDTLNRTAGPRLLVLGNEKGGTGKSTLALHLAVALLYQDLRVATLDLDSEQRTLSRYIANRRRARTADPALPMPEHLGLAAEPPHLAAAELRHALDYFKGFDVVVIDTPGYETPLGEAAHAAADLLVTPINDSFVDLDVLRPRGPDRPGADLAGSYGERVREHRLHRGRNHPLEWLVVRNRVSALAARNARRVSDSLDTLAAALGFRVVDGILERVIYRELFLDGLTVADLPALADRRAITLSHVAARQELRTLIAAAGCLERSAA